MGLSLYHNKPIFTLCLCFWDKIFAPDFMFYTYYCLEDMQGHSVGEYRKARKLYQVTNIDKDDFPKFVNN